MANLFLKLLFWPWFDLQDAIHFRESLPPAITTDGDFVSFLMPIVLFLFLSSLLLPNFFKQRNDWPGFLKASIFSFVWAFYVGVLGAFGNFFVALANNRTGMPTMESFGFLSLGHVPATDGTKLAWLSNCIRVDSSGLLEFLFKYDNPVSPGDLMIAGSVIVCWWIALLVFLWATLYFWRTAYRRTPSYPD